MTRGKMILVDKQDNDILLHKTCEFNGDMYIEWYGKGIVAELEHIYKYEEFKKYVKYFLKVFTRGEVCGKMNSCY